MSRDLNYLAAGNGEQEVPFVFDGECEGARALLQSAIALLVADPNDPTRAIGAGAYSYLPASTVDFPTPDVLARDMELAGLRNVIYRTLMFGSVAIHVGTK